MTVLKTAAALLVLAGAASPAVAQERDTVPRPRPDTIRIGPRGDTARARPPIAPPAGPARRDTLRPGRDTLYIGGRPAQRPRPDTLPSAPSDSDAVIFSGPDARSLVERTIRSVSTLPEGLEDYRARMYSTVSLSIRGDTAPGGETPVTVDEFAGTVEWDRRDALVQTVTGQRIRMLAPTPYTVGTLLEAPWVLPHLYGNTISVFAFSGTPGGRARVSAAVHPFSWRGLDYYRYTLGDTVRVRSSQGVTTLVPVEVRPRRPGVGQERTVAGTFWIDADRAAIARARFGFTEREGRFLAATETGTFFELENALVRGRFWLPYRQRRELQISSPLFAGAAAVRVVTALTDFELNTGWEPAERGQRLARAIAPGDTVFRGFSRAVGELAAESDIADFTDLRAAVRPPAAGAGPVRVSLRYERTDHLFRYNRVEGAYLGLGFRLEPSDPDDRSWDVYGTGGWAFGEGTARGELSARWHPIPASPGDPQWIVAASGYRRLPYAQPFRAPLTWDLGYSIGAALAGYDIRDWYDATGAELQVSRRRGRFTARLGGRWEEQDSVSQNVEGGIFGGEPRDFPALAAVEPGTHAAVEGELRYGRGAGAFSVGNSVLASLAAEAGFGDFQVQRVTGFLSLRRTGRYLTLIGRGDAGVIAGEAPPQFLYRFGGNEGLRGYDRNEFGGTVAALGRGRLVLHLPPYGNRPLYRSGFFVLPPLRPGIVVSGDAGWSDVNDDSAISLVRLGSRITDGVRYSYGTGLSFFEDAVSIEDGWPGDGGEGKWYLGFTSWF